MTTFTTYVFLNEILDKRTNKIIEHPVIYMDTIYEHNTLLLEMENGNISCEPYYYNPLINIIFKNIKYKKCNTHSKIFLNIEEEDLLCPISMDVLQEPVFLKGFFFNKKELDIWLNENNKHPITREQIGTNRYHNISLISNVVNRLQKGKIIENDIIAENLTTTQPIDINNIEIIIKNQYGHYTNDKLYKKPWYNCVCSCKNYCICECTIIEDCLALFRAVRILNAELY